MRALLVPVGRGRFELYAEPPPEDDTAVEPRGGVRRWLHTAGEQWRDIVDTARRGEATGRFGRWRDSVVCRLADSIDEQRTMWALRRAGAADLLIPSTLDPVAARATLDGILQTARRHHGWWLAIDLTLFIASGVLFFVPGPNIVAYYLGFRTFGHLQSWRGAKQGLEGCRWTLIPAPELARIAELAGRSHREREAEVEAIAARLGLEHFAAFFERASS